jgi:hypothetical protein
MTININKRVPYTKQHTLFKEMVLMYQELCTSNVLVKCTRYDRILSCTNIVF